MLKNTIKLKTLVAPIFCLSVFTNVNAQICTNNSLDVDNIAEIILYADSDYEGCPLPLSVYDERMRVETISGPKSFIRDLSRKVVRIDFFEKNEEIYEVSSCSGFFVFADKANSKVLTAGHCVKGRKGRVVMDLLGVKTDKQGAVPGYWIVNSSDSITSNNVSSSPVLTQVITFENDEDVTDYSKSGIDLALINLPGIVTSERNVDIGDFRVANPYFNDDTEGADLFMLHHPYGLPIALSQVDCRSTGPKRHSCISFRGSSGAPLFSRRTGNLIGMHTDSDGAYIPVSEIKNLLVTLGSLESPDSVDKESFWSSFSEKFKQHDDAN